MFTTLDELAKTLHTDTETLRSFANLAPDVSAVDDTDAAELAKIWNATGDDGIHVDMSKCTDCDAPAVRVSASDSGNRAPLPRCERHALPEDPRNPATVHFWGVDGKTACFMAPRTLDGQHHRAISYDDGDSTCAQCNEYVQKVIDDAAEEAHEADMWRDGPIVPAEITIPAVTDAQRIEAREAAVATVLHARSGLGLMASTLLRTPSDHGVVRAAANDLRALADRLEAAAGHLRIASGE